MKQFKLLSILLLAGTMLGLAANKYRNYYYTNQQRANTAKLKTRWGAGAFVEIPLSEKVSEELLQAPVLRAATNDFVSSQMANELTSTLTLMLQCFSTGDIAMYHAFHFPVDTEAHGQLNPGRMALIRAAAHQAVSQFNAPLLEHASDEETFVSWGYYQASQPPYHICTNCWRKCNYEDIKIHLSLLTHTNPPSLHRIAQQFEPLQSTSVFDSVVTYRPSAEELLATDVPVLFAFVRIPVEMSQGDVGVYPVYASFYWCNAYEKWIPLQLALPSTESSLRVWF